LKAEEALNGPAVGDHDPRFCEMGASATDVNSHGCIEDKEHLPVRSHVRAVYPATDSGIKDLNYNKRTPNEQPAGLPRPWTVQNQSDSKDGSVYIPFAYV
jgi:hypothetical protein